VTISYNPKKAESEQFKKLPPGTYHAQVAEATEKTSSKGDPMISLKWHYLDGDFTLCFDNLVFNDGGRGIAHKKLKMMGVAIPDEDMEFSLDASDLVGMEAMLTVVEETYKGKTNLKPDFGADGFGYAPVPGSVPVRPKSNEKFDDTVPF